MNSDKKISALQLVVLPKQQIGEEAFEVNKRQDSSSFLR